MNRYYVKIDGQEAPESYTYEELRNMGVLDFDDIQVRKMLDSNWYSAKYYNFPESSSTPDIEIDEDAFNGCDSLVKVSIPFGSKHKFEEYFPYNIKILVEQNEEENLYTKVTDEDLAEGKEILLYGGGIYSPDNKRLLVAPKNITRLIVGERTKVICDGAFNRCFDLEFVSIPDGVTKIGKVAFSHCFALKTISIPEGNAMHSTKSISFFLPLHKF